MEIKELSKLLAQDTLGVCHYLFPGKAGKEISGNFCIGDLRGKKGDSLRVALGGTKAGLWTDFADDTVQGGDLIDLWRQVRRLSLVETLQEVKDYLGIKDQNKYYEKRAVERFIPAQKITPAEGETRDYLLGRGLADGTLLAFSIGQARDKSVVFPSFKNGVVLRYKMLGLSRPNGSKKIHLYPTAADAEKEGKVVSQCLFGWQTIGDAREVTIDEGEINAMTLWQYGRPALAVPIGAKNLGWIEEEYDDLDRFDTIYIRADNDEPGKAMVEMLAARLGHHRCRVLRFPEGDPNDYLQKGYTKKQIDEIYENAEFLHPEELKRPIDFTADVIKVFYPDPHVKRGFIPRFRYLQPSNPQEQPKLEFRYGEVSVWAGYNGEGKSQIAKIMQLDAITQDERVMVLDLEQHPKITLHRLVRSITAQQHPSPQYIEKALHWITDKIWLYDTTLNGVVTLERLSELFTYAAKRYGITQFFLDSLMKLEDVPEDDINAQKKAINVLCEIARVQNVHIHIVAHFKKPAAFSRSIDITNPPDRFEISGSGKISDAAFNVILVHRNRFKEDILSGKREIPTDSSGRPLHTREYYENQPDCIMNVDKQKNGESWSGYVKLWWDQLAQQFLNEKNEKPKVYLKFQEKFK